MCKTIKTNTWELYHKDDVELTEIEGLELNPEQLKMCWLSVAEKQLYLPFRMDSEYHDFIFSKSQENAVYHVKDTHNMMYTLKGQHSVKGKGDGCVIGFDQIIEGDYVSTNTNLLVTTKLKYEAYYLNNPCPSSTINIQSTKIEYGENVTIEILNKWSPVTLNLIPIEICVSAKKEQDLSKYVYSTLDLLYLFIGETPHDGNFYATYKNKEILVRRNLPKKYDYTTRILENNILQNVDSKTFTIELYNKFSELKDEINDLINTFMYFANANLDARITCVNLLYVLEGLGKYSNVGTSLKSILSKYIGGEDKYLQKIFDYGEEDLKKIRKYLDNLRNYHSHYGGEFVDNHTLKEYICLKTRLELIDRIIILNLLGVEINPINFNAVLKSINNLEEINDVDIMTFQ